MTRTGTGEEDCSANVEQAAPDQFDMILEDTDGETSSGRGWSRAPPGILDQDRVPVFVEEFGRRVPSQSGDVVSPADDPNDDVNLSDIVSVDSVGGPEEVAPNTPTEPELVAGLPRNVTLRMALLTLDEVDPAVVFRQRAAVMRSVLHFLRSPFRNELKLALEAASWGNCRDDEVRQERGWKLFMLSPRLLLHQSHVGQTSRCPSPTSPALPPEIMGFQPATLFNLDEKMFCQNLRSARRGRRWPIRDEVGAMQQLFKLGETLAPAVVNMVRCGRMTALAKPDGGVRSIVSGDVLRRPHFPQSQLTGLRGVDGGNSSLPFVRLFCGSPSEYLWEDDFGEMHSIPQGEGGKGAPSTLVLRWSTRGPPSGTSDAGFLNSISEEHQTLLRRIPLVGDVQAAWLLLVHCAGARANFAMCCS